jgi:hypothetical protein
MTARNSRPATCVAIAVSGEFDDRRPFLGLFADELGEPRCRHGHRHTAQLRKPFTKRGIGEPPALAHDLLRALVTVSSSILALARSS